MTVGFVAYIDESGDPGIRRVFPNTSGGASEWFTISCVVVGVEHDPEVLPFVRSIVDGFGNSQRSFLHFRDLNDSRKRIVCDAIASYPLRCFVAMSNKKNMEGHYNVAPWPEKNWFYQWMSRVLLERVTEFCAAISQRRHREHRTVRLIFSRRGGLSRDRLQAYIGLLKFQSETNSLYLPTRRLVPSVIDLNEIHVHDHKARAGLQLADAVASAFYQAVSMERGVSCEPQFAKLLKPRIYRRLNGRILDNGLKPFPGLRKMNLHPQQREIFEFYGFPQKEW